ncbi:MAG: S9 family peptidase, partial [Muribaculaceae bacterium]|nr:S9 family peptidase [Muribaculaceae bacterium]
GPDIKRRFTLDDSEFGNRVSSISMSPDGRWLITKYYNYYSRDRYRVWATLTDIKSGRVVNENFNADAKWMPSGKRLYYTRAAAEGYDLFTVDPATGAEQLMLSSIPTNSITWSPTEDYFIYHHYEAGVQEYGPLRRYASPDDRQPGNRQRWFLIKYDVATGLSERITFGNHTTSLADISPDGKRLLCTTSWDTPTVRPFYSQCIYQLDLATLTADTLVTPSPSFVSSAFYSPDGRSVAFVGSPEAFGGIGKNCAPHPIANDFDHQIFLMNLDGDRSVRSLTRDFNPNVKNVACWNTADGRIYFTAEDGFYNRIYALTPSTGKIEQLPIEVDNASMSMGDREANYLAYMGQGYEYMGRAYLYNVKRHTSTLLADPSA